MTTEASGEPDGGEALIRLLNDIEATDVSAKRLDSFTTEDDYNGLSVELLVEVGKYVVVASSVLPGDNGLWDRNQAILGGHLVRLHKLISAMLDQICQHRREITFILARLAFECIVNARFLIQAAEDPEVFASYVRYSLKQEKRLHERINQNIERRGGKASPVETRMLNSIAKTLNASGETLDTVSTSRPKEWANKNLYQRAETLGWEELYLGTFGGPSASVHGNWMDLLENHLEEHDGQGFSPRGTWRHPRPQIGDTIALLTVEAVQDYLNLLFGDDLALSPLHDLSERILTAMRSHEDFLARGGI